MNFFALMWIIIGTYCIFLIAKRLEYSIYCLVILKSNGLLLNSKTCGGGAGCPWVAGRLGANGGHGMIAVRTGLAWRVAWGRQVLALQGLPPFENSRIRFIFLSFILFSICI